jgi:hypothetical protein
MGRKCYNRVKETVEKSAEWILLAQDRDLRKAFVKTIMQLRVSYKRGIHGLVK